MPVAKRRPVGYSRLSRNELFDLGVRRAAAFCRLNGLPVPPFHNVPRSAWVVGACGYYRPDTERNRKWTTPGVNVCPDLCARPCGAEPSRQWSWPGYVVDRTPYGVVLHELGHHADWCVGGRKGTYYSEFCEEAKAAAGEPGLTSYADENPAEWFAEAFRLFAANPVLLEFVRPRTCAVLNARFTPVTTADWRTEMGTDVPDRVVRAATNKGAR
jgi:hypothetical protein